MTTELVLAPQKYKKRGWVLVLDNKFWGETTPEDRSHGGGRAGYGLINFLNHQHIYVTHIYTQGNI